MQVVRRMQRRAKRILSTRPRLTAPSLPGPSQTLRWGTSPAPCPASRSFLAILTLHARKFIFTGCDLTVASTVVLRIAGGQRTHIGRHAEPAGSVAGHDVPHRQPLQSQQWPAFAHLQRYAAMCQAGILVSYLSIRLHRGGMQDTLLGLHITAAAHWVPEHTL